MDAWDEGRSEVYAHGGHAVHKLVTLAHGRREFESTDVLQTNRLALK